MGHEGHPRTRNFASGPQAFVLQETRGRLRLVDISRTPSGALKKKVHPTSRKWLAKKAKSPWRFVAFRDANSARDRPAIVVQALLELVAALIARF